MTAGRGIIHSESIEAEGRSRILQLWIALPARDRALDPQFEIVRGETAPRIEAPGVEARLYSGRLGALLSPTRNRVPTTMVDVKLAPDATFEQELPPAYNGFIYVLEGSARVEDSAVTAGQVGWLTPSASSHLALGAGPRGARLVLYAGQPIGEPLVQQGPFVAGSRVEIAEFHREFRAGHFTSMSRLADAQRRGLSRG
jgi:redox-sensitive bicupin YhaK (pirin superfamily)